MTEPGQTPVKDGSGGREPIFLLPGSITALAGVLVAIHLASTMVLNIEGQAQLYVWFAYQPLRFLLAQQDVSFLIPLIWTPFSHAFLHGSWDHLLLNTAWLVIFATPVTRRYGAGPMLAIFLVSAAAGAAAFTLTSLYAGMFLIGASGGVAGLTGAAVRFIFQPVLYTRHPETGAPIVLGRRLATIPEVFSNSRARFFTLIWLVLNAAVPLAPLLMGQSLGIAWQAHLGGFFAGFFMVALFERRAKA
ncbi:MAG: rhomboid family intramembrane serine protease [Devosia sp.]|nr:rhomboid family intramembrane serine protease [Devosia sp.]